VSSRVRDVAVACFLPGGVIDELAHMLVRSFEAVGVSASFVSDVDAIPSPGPHLVVLLGQGPEFGDLAWLRPDDRASGRRHVVFWGLDPLPPPGMAPDVVARQLEVARVRERMLGSGGGSKVLGHVPRPLKALARRVVAGRSPLADDTRADVPAFDARTFYRLHWIKEHVERGDLQVVMGTNGAFVETLREQGIAAEREPVGFSPEMGHDEGRERDIDVLFLGSVDASRPTRARILSELRDDLSASGLDLVVPSGPVFGARRSELLNRSKIILNLRSNTWHPELIRFVLAAACGTAVVTDPPVTYMVPFVDGEHFVAADAPELAAVLRRLACDDPSRSRITRNAEELVMQHLQMVDTARRIVERAARG
jgi:hypothetical protein